MGELKRAAGAKVQGWIKPLHEGLSSFCATFCASIRATSGGRVVAWSSRSACRAATLEGRIVEIDPSLQLPPAARPLPTATERGNGQLRPPLEEEPMRQRCRGGGCMLTFLLVKANTSSSPAAAGCSSTPATRPVAILGAEPSTDSATPAAGRTRGSATTMLWLPVLAAVAGAIAATCVGVVGAAPNTSVACPARSASQMVCNRNKIRQPVSHQRAPRTGPARSRPPMSPAAPALRLSTAATTSPPSATCRSSARAPSARTHATGPVLNRHLTWAPIGLNTAIRSRKVAASKECPS